LLGSHPLLSLGATTRSDIAIAKVGASTRPGEETSPPAETFVARPPTGLVPVPIRQMDCSSCLRSPLSVLHCRRRCCVRAPHSVLMNKKATVGYGWIGVACLCGNRRHWRGHAARPSSEEEVLPKRGPRTRRRLLHPRPVVSDDDGVGVARPVHQLCNTAIVTCVNRARPRDRS
jgi:hypothetical protein